MCLNLELQFGESAVDIGMIELQRRRGQWREMEEGLELAVDLMCDDQVKHTAKRLRKLE